MNELHEFCDELEKQLQVLESEVEGVRDKMLAAPHDSKAQASQLLDRWPEAVLVARRRLAELRLSDADWATLKDDTLRMWARLKELVADANAAF